MKQTKLIAVLTVAAITAVGTACSRDKSNPVAEKIEKPSTKVQTKEELEIASTLKAMSSKTYAEGECSKEEMETGRAALNLKNRFEASDSEELPKVVKGMITHLSKNPNVFCKVSIIGEIAKFTTESYVDSKTPDYKKAGIVVDGISDLYEESTHQIAAIENDKKPFVELRETYDKTVESVAKNFDIVTKNLLEIGNSYNADEKGIYSELSNAASHFRVFHQEWVKNAPAKIGELEPNSNDEQEDAIFKTKALSDIERRMTALVDMSGRFLKLLKEEKAGQVLTSQVPTPEETQKL